MKLIKVQVPAYVYALVDDDDYDMVSRHKWTLTTNGYAMTHVGNRAVLMHRLILGIEDKGPGIEGHHLNSNNTLDNRRGNLSQETLLSHNHIHVDAHKHPQERHKAGYSSRFKYVYWRKDRQMWMAMPTLTGNKRKSLGIYSTEEEAKAAVDAFLTGSKA